MLELVALLVMPVVMGVSSLPLTFTHAKVTLPLALATVTDRVVPSPFGSLQMVVVPVMSFSETAGAFTFTVTSVESATEQFTLFVLTVDVAITL